MINRPCASILSLGYLSCLGGILWHVLKDMSQNVNSNHPCPENFLNTSISLQNKNFTWQKESPDLPSSSSVTQLALYHDAEDTEGFWNEAWKDVYRIYTAFRSITMDDNGSGDTSDSSSLVPATNTSVAQVQDVDRMPLKNSQKEDFPIPTSQTAIRSIDTSSVVLLPSHTIKKFAVPKYALLASGCALSLGCAYKAYKLAQRIYAQRRQVKASRQKIKEAAFLSLWSLCSALSILGTVSLQRNLSAKSVP
jgi:hypothetical protein